MSNEDWWNNLSPDEQDQLMGGGGSAFDFSYAPDETSFGVQPDVSYFTTKGKTKPADLAEEAKRVNLLQDYGSLSVDNILSGYAGGGAYDVGAFTPTYEYGAPLNVPGRRKAEALAKAGGWQGFVSDLILNQGMSPAEAENELYKVISAPDDATLAPADRAKKQSLMESLPPNMSTGPVAPGNRVGGKPATGRAAYDTKQITDFTSKVWGDLMSDPDVAYQDPKTGLAYSKTPEEALQKTPQMAAYDKFGIPYPTASYEDQKYVDAMTQMESGLGPDEYQSALDRFGGEQARLGQRATRTSSNLASAQTAADKLQRGYDTAVARQVPATEFSSMLDAFRTGQDQTNARDAFRAYTRGGGEPPMTPGSAPWSTVNSAGNRVIQRPGEPNAARSMFDFFRKGAFEKQEPTTLEKLTPQLLEKQRGQVDKTKTARKQARHEAYQASERDPRLAQIAAMGRAYAMAQLGQTPYRDAMAARNANARRMLSGG